MSATEDLPSAAIGSSQSEQAAAFAEDPRIHFDRQSGTWRIEDDNGDELEYDPVKGTWIPVVSARLLSPWNLPASYGACGI